MDWILCFGEFLDELKIGVSWFWEIRMFGNFNFEIWCRVQELYLAKIDSSMIVFIALSLLLWIFGSDRELVEHS